MGPYLSKQEVLVRVHDSVMQQKKNDRQFNGNFVANIFH